MNAIDIPTTLSIISISLSTITAIAGVVVAIWANRNEYRKSLISIEKFHSFISTVSENIDEAFSPGSQGNTAYDVITNSFADFRQLIAPLRYEKKKLFTSITNSLSNFEDALTEKDLNRSKPNAEKYLCSIDKQMRRYYRCLFF